MVSFHHFKQVLRKHASSLQQASGRQDGLGAARFCRKPEALQLKIHHVCRRAILKYMFKC